MCDLHLNTFVKQQRAYLYDAKMKQLVKAVLLCAS